MATEAQRESMMNNGHAVIIRIVGDHPESGSGDVMLDDKRLADDPTFINSQASALGVYKGLATGNPNGDTTAGSFLAAASLLVGASGDYDDIAP